MWGLSCCPPSFNRQAITMTGNVLITLLLLPCNSLMVTKHFWVEFSFYLFSKLVDKLKCGMNIVYRLWCSTFFWSSTVWAFQRELKNRNRKCNEIIYNRIKRSWRNLLNVAKNKHFLLISLFVFSGFRLDLEHVKNLAGIFIKLKRKHVALSGLIPYFPWLSHSWRRIRGLRGWGHLHWRRCYPFEDCNLRLYSNQSKFLWYGMRASVPSRQAFNTPNRVLFSFMFLLSSDIIPSQDIEP